MILSCCGRGVGGAKLVRLQCSNSLQAGTQQRTTHIRVAEIRVSTLNCGLFAGTRALSGWLCQHVQIRVSRNSLEIHGSKLVASQRSTFAAHTRPFAAPALGRAGAEPRDGQSGSEGAAPHGFVSHRAVQVGTRSMDPQGVDEPLTVRPQVPGEPDLWWRIPDHVGDVLPLPKHFNAHVEVLYDNLGCRILSRELLLRILVHKSFYLSKMPPALKGRKLRRPLMSWQRLETETETETEVGDDTDVMTFAEAHGEARLQLALLGDTVLNLAASLHLIRQHPLLSTGLITERRSQLVCNSNLARVWSTLLDLRELVLCDPPLSQSKKPSATTVLEFQMKACADTLEAYVGGVYVEKGLETALQCVETRLLPLLLLAEPTRNPVALLHERCVILLQEKPDYKLIGIDNKNTPNEACRMRVYVKGHRLSTGIGKSQKLARRDAAEKALIKWPQIFGSAS